MARLISVNTSSVEGNFFNKLPSFDPGGSEEPHFDSMYLGSVGSRMRAARKVLEGALSVRVECSQIPVYSSPRVCVAMGWGQA